MLDKMEFKYIELFAGIGGFRQALDRLGGKCVFASEIDKFAAQAYEALYGEKPAGDITQIDAKDIPDHDLLTAGFPCQAFSVAGKRLGFEDTRGTLFFEIVRIAKEKRPKVLLLENVKGLVSHDKGRTLETIVRTLNEIGYAVDFEVLNSKYFGVPQNRERVFIVCDRDAEHAEWVVKGTDVVAKAKRRIKSLGVRTFNFDWPEQGEVTTRLRDILETDVDEKYYLSDDKTAKLVAQLAIKDKVPGTIGHHPFSKKLEFKGYNSEISPALVATDYKAPKTLLESEPQMVGSLEHYGNDQMNRVYSVDGVSPTITVVSGGGREQKIAEPQINKIGHLPSDSGQTGAVYGPDGIAPTCLNQHGNAVTKIAEIQQYTDGSGISYTIDANYAKGTSPGDIGKGRRTHVVEVAALTEQQVVVYSEDDDNALIECGECSTRFIGLSTKCPTCNRITIGKRIFREEIRPVLTPDREEKRQNGRRFKEDGEEAFTLTAQDRHGVAIGKYPRYRIRKLTPLECFRLQGFPDEVHDAIERAGISNSQRYKMAGNAVTVNVVEAIGRRLIPMFKRKGGDQYDYQSAHMDDVNQCRKDRSS